MSQRGKKYKASCKLFNKNKEYSLLEAIECIKKMHYVQFDETFEGHFKIKYKSVQNIRGSVSLPHGTGKKVKVLVFADGDAAEEAKQAGADYVGYKDLIEKIQKGWFDFHYVVSTPFLMKDVGKLGPVLGPKNLMPNPKMGTVTANVKNIITELKKGRIHYKSDKTGVVHLALGKLSFSSESLLENTTSAFQTILKNRPSDSKGEYIVSASFAGTQTPSVRVPMQKMRNL